MTYETSAVMEDTNMLDTFSQQIQGCLQLIIDMSAPDRLKAADLWNDASIKLQHILIEDSIQENTEKEANETEEIEKSTISKTNKEAVSVSFKETSEAVQNIQVADETNVTVTPSITFEDQDIRRSQVTRYLIFSCLQDGGSPAAHLRFACLNLARLGLNDGAKLWVSFKLNWQALATAQLTTRYHLRIF